MRLILMILQYKLRGGEGSNRVSPTENYFSTQAEEATLSSLTVLPPYHPGLKPEDYAHVAVDELYIRIEYSMIVRAQF